MFARFFEIGWLFGRKVDRTAMSIHVILSEAGVPRLQKALPLINGELQRARRYGRTMTIALLWGESGAAGEASVEHGTAHPPHSHASVVPALIAALLRETMREIDIVTYASGIDRCVVVMPESGDEEARLAFARLRRMCSDRLEMPVHATLAVFPADGLTLGELIRAADENGRPAVLQPASSGGSREAVRASGNLY
jgi:hypothetical protein